MNWKYALVWTSFFLLLTVNGYSQKYILYSDLGRYPKDSVYAIDASKNKWKAFPQELTEYKNVTHLNLSRNPIESMKGIEGMQQLQYLNIDKIKMVHFPIEIIQLTELKELILSRNEIESLPKEIQYLKNLEVLDLYGTMILSVPKEMQLMYGLKRIDFTGVSLNAHEQKAIKEMLPGVKMKMDAPCNCMSH